MAIHQSKESMLKESLNELVLVVKYCVNFRKNPSVWGSKGCYGYPAAILLLSIADSIGAYVLGGNAKKHFNILNHKDYYNLGLNKKQLEIIYKFYRCPLVHEGIMKPDVVLDIGKKKDTVYENKTGQSILRLVPFLELTEKIVSGFLRKLTS